MGKKNTIVLSAAALLVVAGCAGNAVPVPESPPPRVIAPSTMAEPNQTQDNAAPPLVAPPPAYGNKVVLARSTSTPAAF